MGQLILPILLFVGMYMLLIRPQQKRLKEQQALIASVSEGDRVLMASGIYGTVTEVLDVSLYVELAEGFEILINRQAIQEILDEFPLDDGPDDELVEDTDDSHDIEDDADDSEDAEA